MSTMSGKHTLEEDLLINKLESLMLVAGGISHDLNNVLTMLFGHLSLARQYSRDEHTTRILTEAEKACLKVKDITRQLLEFSRGGIPMQKVVNLPELVKNISQFVLRGTNISTFFTSSKNISPVLANEAQLSQVFMNLLINAVQAMPKGGIITIGVENSLIKPESALPLKDGPYVHAWVEDEGVGIPARFIPRVFDCHFTTKPSGSGLGLTISQMIVKNHGGCMTVESEEDKGSTFSVYLPAQPRSEPGKR